MSDLTPAALQAYADAYQCTDCDSDTELIPDPDTKGLWKLAVYHDDGCPVLQGYVSSVEAGVSAATQTPGTLYVGPVDR